MLDLLSYLKFLQNPLDNYSLSAFLRSRYLNWSLTALRDALELPGDTLFEKLMNTSSPEIQWLFALIESGEYQLERALAALFKNASYFPTATEAFLELLRPLLATPLTISRAVARLEEWEKEDILVTSQATEEKRMVRLMTVHAAKGLEFPHVLLVDTLRQPARHTPTLRLEDDTPPGLRYRVNGEVVLNRYYTEIQNREEQNDLEEGKRILYVAITRPQRSLSILMPKDPKAAPKGSWARLLEECLCQTPNK